MNFEGKLSPGPRRWPWSLCRRASHRRYDRPGTRTLASGIEGTCQRPIVPPAILLEVGMVLSGRIELEVASAQLPSELSSVGRSTSGSHRVGAADPGRGYWRRQRAPDSCHCHGGARPGTDPLRVGPGPFPRGAGPGHHDTIRVRVRVTMATRMNLVGRPREWHTILCLCSSPGQLKG